MLSLILGILNFLVIVAIFLFINDKIDKARREGIEEGIEQGIKKGQDIEFNRNVRLREMMERCEKENDILQKKLRELQNSGLVKSENLQKQIESENMPLPKQVLRKKMPEEMQRNLNGLTFLEADERNLLIDLGTDKDLVSFDDDVNFYILINHYPVRISSELAVFLDGKTFTDEDHPDIEILMNLKFAKTKDHSEFGYNENGWFYIYYPEIESIISNDDFDTDYDEEMNQQIDYSDNSVKPEENKKKKRNKKVEDKYVNPWGEDAGSYINNGIKYCNKHYIPLDSKGKCSSCGDPPYRNNLYNENGSNIADDLPF